jgi:hypothetical protein
MSRSYANALKVASLIEIRKKVFVSPRIKIKDTSIVKCEWILGVMARSEATAQLSGTKKKAHHSVCLD